MVEAHITAIMGLPHVGATVLLVNTIRLFFLFRNYHKKALAKKTTHCSMATSTPIEEFFLDPIFIFLVIGSFYFYLHCSSL
jgi:hypothetical protein